MTETDIPKCEFCSERVFSPCTEDSYLDCVLRSCILSRNENAAADEDALWQTAVGEIRSGIAAAVAMQTDTKAQTQSWGTALNKQVLEDAEPDTKATNPKDAVGIAKVPMSVVSAAVMAEVGVGMMEGGLKYGRHNYRDAGIRYSVYYDATLRHMMQWWEGEDTDTDSGLSHVTKAICSLMVLRDAMIQNLYTDDRPPKSPGDFMAVLNEKAKALLVKYPNPVAAITQEGMTSGT